MKRKIALIGFCLAYAVISAWIIIESLDEFKNRKTTIRIQKISVPQHVSPDSDSLRVLEDFYQSHFKK